MDTAVKISILSIIKRKILFKLCIVELFLSVVQAWPQDEKKGIAWEPDEIKPIFDKIDESDHYIIKPDIVFANWLINFYQKDISPHSISRCPFAISCSNYAHIAVNKYGLLLGICFFIDRNFYREHIAAYNYYGLRENVNGIIKLDDSYFLDEELDE